MGKIGTKTNLVIWSTYEKALYWSKELANPPYLEQRDFPKNYGFWGEIVTIFDRIPGGFLYQARAYFLPRAALKAMNDRSIPAHKRKYVLLDAPLKWIDFEPGRHSLNEYNPENIWFINFIAGHQGVMGFSMPRPASRVLTQAKIAERRKKLRQSVQEMRKAQNVRLAAARETKKEEAIARRDTRDDTIHEANKAILGFEDEEDVELLTDKQASDRLKRAEQILDSASTEDDISKALQMVAINQAYGKNESNPKFKKKVGIQLKKFIRQSIEVLYARNRELPDSPIEEWHADLARLKRLYREYHVILCFPRHIAAEENIKRWEGKIRHIEKTRNMVQKLAQHPPRTRMNPSRSERGLADPLPDPGIGSEERGIPAGARMTPKAPTGNE